MPKKENENAIRSQMESMTKSAQRLNALTKKRKELCSLIKEKDKHFDHSLSNSVNKLREEERKKRLEVYGEAELRRQKITSSLMMELFQLCKENDVPPYILSIAKILDNYQGKNHIN